MTSAELEVRHESREMAVLTNEQLQYIAGTEFVPPGLRGNLPAILACVATGRALGIADMSALRSIHIIDGKATFSAELMVQLVRRAGHSIVGEVSDGKATVTGTRADNGDTMTATWTVQMAERAGLLGKSNWKKYPEAMLWARAASQLCRMLFADCFAGATYTPEELEDGGSLGPRAVSVGDQGDVAGVAPGEPQDALPAEDDQVGEPLMTAAQKRKANTLIGKLRAADRITNEELYGAVGLNPEEFRDENGELHWSPLRDTLPKDKASRLIDLLQKHEESSEQVLQDPWFYDDAPNLAALETELLTLSERLGKRTEMESAVEKHRGDPGFAAWLDGALVRARGAAATSEEAA
jgi:hypothetical protein